MYQSSQFPKLKNKLLIFDFDGVLADSFIAFYLLIKESMGNIGLSLSPSQYRNFFKKNVHQSFKDFIKDERRYAVFLELRKNNYDTYYYDPKNGVNLFSEVPHFIKKIRKDYILTIASSGKDKNIKKILSKYKIKNAFKIILASNELSKERMIHKILSRLKNKPSKVIMISDTTGDIKIAKTMGLKTIGVTWGFHDSEILKKSRPDGIARNFKQLKIIIDSLLKS